jgi:hypothetical protein
MTAMRQPIFPVTAGFLIVMTEMHPGGEKCRERPESLTATGPAADYAELLKTPDCASR